MINKKSVMFGILGLAVLMISFASAAGVVSDYTTDRPLKMYPGETQTVTFTLQNLAGDEDMTFSAMLEENAEGMAVLVHEDPTYSIPLGNTASVPFKVTVPADAQIGDTYTIKGRFSQVSESEGEGMVNLVGGTSYKITLEITSREDSSFYEPVPTAPATATSTGEETSNTLWYIIAAIIIIVVILYFVTKKKK